MKAVQIGPDAWDFYAHSRDEFLMTVSLSISDQEKMVGVLDWALSDSSGSGSEYAEAMRFVSREAFYSRGLKAIKTTAPVHHASAENFLILSGFKPGRDFGPVSARSRRYLVDRFSLVQKLAEHEMSRYLDTNKWVFTWDSAKRRFGVCRHYKKEIGLSRHYVEHYDLASVHQTILHEIAHALAGPEAGHGKEWKKIASRIGYRHEKIDGEAISKATAKLVGTCPAGHILYRHRKPRTPLSCGICSKNFDKRFLITWSPM